MRAGDNAYSFEVQGAILVAGSHEQSGDMETSQKYSHIFLKSVPPEVIKDRETGTEEVFTAFI